MLGGAIFCQHLPKHIGLICIAVADQLGKDALLFAAENVAVGMVPVRHLDTSAISALRFQRVIDRERCKDTETEHTYGALQLMAGAIEASITPENADPDVQHADDVEFDVLYPDPELTFKTKMADVPLAIQEMVFGNQIDDNGVLVRTASDRPPLTGCWMSGRLSSRIQRRSWNS